MEAKQQKLYQLRNSFAALSPPHTVASRSSLQLNPTRKNKMQSPMQLSAPSLCAAGKD